MVQCISAAVHRALNMLSHSARRQQGVEATGIWIFGVLCPNVEITADDDRAGVDDQRLKNLC